MSPAKGDMAPQPGLQARVPLMRELALMPKRPWCLIYTTTTTVLREASNIEAAASHMTPEVTLWIAASVACDILITLSLVWVFSRQKNKTNFARTNGIINKLIRYSVETGGITTFLAVLNMVFWLTCRQWNFYFIFFLLNGKMYSNALMAQLNARAPTFSGEQGGSSNGPVNSFWGDTNWPPIANAALSSRGGVHISRTTNVVGDADTIVMNDFVNDTRGKLSPDKAYTLT
ncbi:hypothetical protein C8F04DRAFT_1388466 [Mycena alexandri]|uniref:DUF6534 domain-containing protein n=1 Tax=Mycena alexandri TaxID=1745969 RepID=A0AAD6TG06_9AGAR|nr:hypothetical protein C8F04DRAFT_1388466 [Mycena alexandri]